MNNCPYCNSNSGFVSKMRAVGTVEDYYDANGQFVETDIDGLRFEQYSAVVRCADCKRIRRDVCFIGVRVEPVPLVR